MQSVSVDRLSMEVYFRLSQQRQRRVQLDNSQRRQEAQSKKVSHNSGVVKEQIQWNTHPS